MKYMTLVILIFIHIHITYAAEHAFESDQYIYVNNASELIKNDELMAKYRVLDKACELQLANELLPEACYHFLDLEKRLRLPGSFEKTKIDKKCVQIANKTQELQNKITAEMNIDCFIAAAKRIEINIYKSEM